MQKQSFKELTFNPGRDMANASTIRTMKRRISKRISGRKPGVSTQASRVSLGFCDKVGLEFGPVQSLVLPKLAKMIC